MIEPASTLKRPTAKALARFAVKDVGADDVALYLREGYSLAICCRACQRLVEWTPPELQRRFGERPALPIADIAARLTCAGPEGCGSDDIAVFIHLYDGAWRWPAA